MGGKRTKGPRCETGEKIRFSCRGVPGIDEQSGAIIRSGGKGRFVRDSRSRDVTSRSGTPPSLLSCSTPVDRRIKEDAPVETVRDLKRRPRSPRNVYRAAVEKEEEEKQEEKEEEQKEEEGARA